MILCNQSGCDGNGKVVAYNTDQGRSPKHEHNGYSFDSDVFKAHADQPTIEKQELNIEMDGLSHIA